ncbi:hypothetical protein ACFV9C_42250 [Kribbella sp. NPDC059898]|uniref:hypothetical protein n=1 Tax=Kribbella sp. NPDC059898 TaxID=3346995 RepID=UPI00364EC52B
MDMGTADSQDLQDSREGSSAREERVARARREFRDAARREVPLQYGVTLGRDLVDEMVTATVVRVPETDWRLGACEHVSPWAETWHRVQHIYLDKPADFLGVGAAARFRIWDEAPGIDDLRWLETWGRVLPNGEGLTAPQLAWPSLAAWLGKHEVLAVLRRDASAMRVKMRASGEPKPGYETYRGRVGIGVYPAVLNAWHTHWPLLGGLPDRIRIVYMNGDDDHVAELEVVQDPFAEPFPPTERHLPDWWDNGDPCEIGPVPR